ncbi:MAG: HD domain-containing protein [Clostridia bacterium]|nr:HD domain-containing protein [Clostridia bacterium]
MDRAVSETIEYIRGFFSKDFSGHDYYHSMRVYKTAVRIAEKEGADTRTVALAALLHDVDDRKLSPETEKTKANAAGFLRNIGENEETVSEIIKIIGEVPFLGTDSGRPTSKEACCVQDADRLDAMGAIGIARTFAFGGSHGRAIYDPEIPPVLFMNGEEYKNRVSHSVNHFYEKLLLLKNMMNTGEGKALAEKRDAFLREFLEEFYSEWSGES